MRGKAKLWFGAIVVVGYLLLSASLVQSGSSASTTACNKPTVSSVEVIQEHLNRSVLSVRFRATIVADNYMEIYAFASSQGVDLWSGTIAQGEPLVIQGEVALETFDLPADLTVRISTLCRSMAEGNASRSIQIASPYSNCPDYIVIDSRGSGEGPGQASPPGEAFIHELRNKHPGKWIRVFDNDYPAAGSRASMLLALAKAPHSAYNQSVVKGKRWLAAKLKSLASQCGNTPIFLTGYSQGAQVTADVYQSADWSQVQGVILFGDPYFNPDDSAADYGSYSQQQHGALGKRPIYGWSTMGKVLSFCHLHDPVCQGVVWAAKYRFSQHENYDKLGEPQYAVSDFAP